MKKIILALTGLIFTACALGQQPPPGAPPSPQARLKQVTTRLEKDLTLNTAQKQKVQDAYKAFFANMEKLRGSNQGPPPPPPPGKKEDVDKLVKVRDESVKKALTADQYKKYLEIAKTMGPGRRGPGGPPPGGGNGPDDGQGPPPVQ